MITNQFSQRDGFALPMSILAIAFMSAALVAAFSRLSSETRVVDGGRAEMQAFALAQAGLEAKMASGDTTDSTRLMFSKGWADVRVFRIKAATNSLDTSLWLVKSTGVTSGGTSSNPAARRTVAQLTFRMGAQIDVRSAWTSITGLTKNGGSGALAGEDSCHQETAVAGVSVPSGGYVQNGGALVPTGDPAIEQNGTTAQMADSVKVDWDGIVNNGAITPDYTIPPNAWPSFTDPNFWPVIYVDNGPTGTVSIPQGRGLLIIEGNATIGGSRTWDGIILIGGTLVSDGTTTVLGTTITGLNTKLGMTVGTSDVGNGTKTFQYHSCNIQKAAGGLARLIPMTNVWMDNYAAWQ